MAFAQNWNDDAHNKEKRKLYLFLRHSEEKRNKATIPTAILGASKEEDHHRLISSFNFRLNQVLNEKEAGEEVCAPSSADSAIGLNQELIRSSQVNPIKKNIGCTTAPTSDVDYSNPKNILKETPDYFKEAMDGRFVEQIVLAQDASPIFL